MGGTPKSSILMGFSFRNHPAIGVPQINVPPRLSDESIVSSNQLSWRSRGFRLGHLLWNLKDTVKSCETQTVTCPYLSDVRALGNLLTLLNQLGLCRDIQKMDESCNFSGKHWESKDKAMGFRGTQSSNTPNYHNTRLTF